MKILQILIQKSISQWKQCYYDYQCTIKLIMHAHHSLVILQKIRDCQKRGSLIQIFSEVEQPLNVQNFKKEICGGKFRNSYWFITKSVHQANDLFISYHKMNQSIAFQFLQIKTHEMITKIKLYQKFTNYINENNMSIYLNLLMNIYEEIKFLFQMCEVNSMVFNKIQKKHIHNFSPYNIINSSKSLFNEHQELFKAKIIQLQTYRNQLQGLFHTINQPFPRIKKIQIQGVSAKNKHELVTNYLFGLSNGSSLALILLSITVYAQSYFSSYDLKFTQDFPVWRGVGYAVIYLWVLSLDVLVFRKNKINYQLILKFNQISSSSFSPGVASLFTFIYLVLFLFYLLDLTNLISASQNTVVWFPLIIWGLLLGYLFNPFQVLNSTGRMIFIKKILSMIASPFKRVQFSQIFVAEQLVSLILPFSDIVYSFCYYIEQNFKTPNANTCQEYLHTSEYFGFFLFTYRVIQSLKVAYQNKNFIGTKQMFIAIKGILNILILLISVLSRFQYNLIYVWFVLILPIVSYNYFIDLKYHWKLLQTDCSSMLLRNHFIFKDYQYYLIMALSLLFHFAFLLTLSQTIIYQLDLFTFYLVYIVSILQLIRRAFWNIITLQSQHSINCQKLKVKTDYQEKQSILMSSLPENDINKKKIQQQQIMLMQISQENIDKLNVKINKKKQFRAKIQKWNQQQMHKLLNIEIDIQKKYKSSNQGKDQ